MYICRLFRRDSPFEQMEARLIVTGSISLGRDPAADWQLDDPAQTLSRIHCTLRIDGDQLMLSDSSTNGTYFSNGDRAPRDQAVPVEARETLRLGGLSLFIDRPAKAELGGEADRTAVSRPMAMPVSFPSHWQDGIENAAPPLHRDTPLLEAFCEGAGLDVSSLSSEDPVELMRRLGALYQQTIIGLSTLLAERTRLKVDKLLDRTTISAIDNNPLKWAPTRRLGRDLLIERDDAFLTGPDAVRGAFEDLARHLAGTSAGANGAIEAVLALLDPTAIDDEASRQGFSLKGRAALAREIHLRRYQSLGEGEVMKQVFRDAYNQATRRDGAA